MSTSVPTTLRLISALALATGLGAGCGDEHSHENPDEEACEHLKEGPSVPVSATATASTTAPKIANDHKRYDVTLTATPGGASSFLGFVTYAAATAGDYIIYTNASMPLKVSSAANAEVAAETTATMVSQCTEVKGRHVFPLQVGTYNLGFGPAPADKVSVVVETDHVH